MTTAAVPVFARLADWLLTSGARASTWQDQSRCPGWSNSDILIHLTCTLRELVEPASLPAVVPGDIEATNEVQVTAFRGPDAFSLLSDYRDLLSAAVQVLHELQDDSMRHETFSLEDAGTYPVHLAADALVFDHYCHLVHDMTLGSALPPLPAEAAEAALAIAIGWLIAGLPQMSAEPLAPVLTQPVVLALDGPGGGTWRLERRGPDAISVNSESYVGSPRHAIRGRSSDFLLWATHRRNWRELEVSVTGDFGLAARVASAVHVF